MNAIVPASTRAAAPAGLVPRDFDQAMRLAEMMARSELVPQHLQRRPADCLLVVEQAMRWQMSPFAVAQGTFVTKGKIGYAGTLMHAAVEANAPIAGHLNYHFTGEGEGRAVIVSGTLIGETNPREVEVKLREARTENVWWKKTPDQMLCYHGARVWARRHAPGVIFGAYSREELVDAIEAEAPPAVREVPNLAQPGQRSAEVRPSPTLAAEVAAARATLPVIAPSGTLHQVPRERWLAAIGKAVGGLEDAMAMKGWSDAMSEHLGTARALDDALAHQAEQIIAGRIFELAGPPDAEPEPGAVEPEEVL
jgi:hypothetical protein